VSTDGRESGQDDEGGEMSGSTPGRNESAGGDGTGRRVEVYPGREAVVTFDPSLTFECVDSCTWCCHHGVLLYEQDLFELAGVAPLSEATTQFRGEDFVPKEGKDHDHTGPDGQACYFLQEDGLCALHDEHDWKPARCSVFPLSVTVEDGDIHVSVRDSAREHCEGLNVTERRVVDHLDAFLPELLWELDDPETRREL
jgi:Fe-S-cluster containining protein